MNKTTSPRIIALILGVLVMSFSVGYFVFAWTEPSVAPTGGNVSAPLNVGSTAQTKSGVLTLTAGAQMNGITVGKAYPGYTASYGYETIALDPAENLRINFGSNEKFLFSNIGDLTATGNVKGAQLCIGADCRASWPSGGGTTDHGALTGLSDNDHSQYLLKAGDTMTGILTLDGSASSGSTGRDLLKFNISSDNDMASIIATRDGVSSASTIGFWSGDASDWLNVQAKNGSFNGSLTATSNVRADSDGNFIELIDGRVETNRSDGLYIQHNYNTNVSIRGGNKYFQDYNGANTWMTINTSGHVGIGAAPIRKLHVGGGTGGGEFLIGNQLNGANGAAFINISDNSGNNGDTSSLYIRGLISGGSAGADLASLLVYADDSSFSGNVTATGNVKGNQLCIGTDCRSSWPSGGGGSGDITGVTAGTGLTGGGLSGDVTLNLDASHNDGSAFDSRFVNVGGDTMTGNLTVGNGTANSTINVSAAGSGDTFIDLQRGAWQTDNYTDWRIHGGASDLYFERNRSDYSGSALRINGVTGQTTMTGLGSYKTASQLNVEYTSGGANFEEREFSCPSGTMLSGGCFCSENGTPDEAQLRFSWPVSSTAWRCRCTRQSGSGDITIDFSAICSE